MEFLWWRFVEYGRLVHWIEKTYLNLIFLLLGSYWMWLYIIKEKHNISLTDKCRVFSVKIFMKTLNLQKE